MIVMITASTPSLNASRRPVSDSPVLSGERPDPVITPPFSSAHQDTHRPRPPGRAAPSAIAGERGKTPALQGLLPVPAGASSPTIVSDLHVFDQQWGFPDPVLQIDQAGTILPFNPSDSTMVGWAEETTLDVEYAHRIAPGAKILLVQTPVAAGGGTPCFPQMMTA